MASCHVGFNCSAHTLAELETIVRSAREAGLPGSATVLAVTKVRDLRRDGQRIKRLTVVDDSDD